MATEQVMFELQDDDQRQCDICNTTCFLSAVRCPNRPSETMTFLLVFIHELILTMSFCEWQEMLEKGTKVILRYISSLGFDLQ